MQWASPTYVAALRWIAAHSASDTSRRTFPGTPATSTPLRDLLPLGEHRASGAMIK